MKLKAITMGIFAFVATVLGCKGQTVDSGIIDCNKANKKVVKEAVITYTSPHGVNFEQHYFKHASLGIRIDSTWLYVDPVTDKVQPATDYSQMPKADIILVTHEHADHLDAKAIEQLTKDGTVLIANPRSAEILGGNADVMRNGDTKKLKDLTIEAVPAYNTSANKQQFHPKERDNGYVLTVDDLRVYIAGDTEDIDEMSALKDIDVAFLPCNLPFTMSPEQFVRAAKAVNAKLLFVYHYGQTDTKQVLKLLEENGIEAIVRPYM